MPKNYSAERFNPTIAYCSNLSLRFNGRYLTMNGGSRLYRYQAVSGKPINSRFDYSEANQRMPNRGPIPRGLYWINPTELWKRGLRHRLIGQSFVNAWGNYRITIHPFTTTVTYGRGGFFIHGGTIPGSAGCIDLTTNMDTFVGDLGREGVIGRECYMQLFVHYPSANQHQSDQSFSWEQDPDNPQSIHNLDE